MGLGAFSCHVLFAFLFAKTVIAEGRKLNFGQCELNSVSFRELRDNFDAIRENVQTQDNRTDVILLQDSVLLDVTMSESCCLLRHLLRFYIESIFKHYEPTSNLLRRRTSTLANAFLSIKAKLRECHNQNKCSCGEESHRRFKLVLEGYEKAAVDGSSVSGKEPTKFHNPDACPVLTYQMAMKARPTWDVVMHSPKLNKNIAAIKALGEMDLLFAWMERF